MRLQPPELFDFKQPDEWTCWKRRFEQYRVASRSPGVHTAVLMGEEAGDVLMTAKIEEANRQKYDKVIDKFDGFFKVRRNTDFERAKFNRHNQKDDESAEQYITALFHLQETCDFGDGALADELLCDRIIVSIRDTKLSETLMLDSDMSCLDKVMRTVRQKEAVHEQNRQLKRGTQEDPIVVDHVSGGSKPQKPPGPRAHKKEEARNRTKSPQNHGLCKQSGKDHAPTDRCPAIGATCFKCNRKGHFSSKSVVTTTTTTDESFSLKL